MEFVSEARWVNLGLASCLWVNADILGYVGKM